MKVTSTERTIDNLRAVARAAAAREKAAGAYVVRCSTTASREEYAIAYQAWREARAAALAAFDASLDCENPDTAHRRASRVRLGLDVE